MGRDKTDADAVPAANPNPEGNTGYAEPKPKNDRQAQIPGGKREPNDEDGGLEHAPDPKT